MRNQFFRVVILVFKRLPKNLISRLFGYLLSLRLPRPLAKAATATFVKILGIDMKEADKPLSEYPTIQDVFVRKLQDGARVIHGPVCIPADGTLVESFSADSQLKTKVKSYHYDLKTLVFGEAGELKEKFEPFWYTTVYLAPHNYHRVHSPIRGLLKEIRYIPGTLWPVIPSFVERVSHLFSNNERLVFEILSPHGSTVHVVMVGAMNVGKMNSHFWPEMFTNLPPKPSPLLKQIGRKVEPGDELGVFMMGSTVVLVFDAYWRELINVKELDSTCEVKMGENLARFYDESQLHVNSVG